MGLTELFILAVGLSMDAFAVAVCKGLAMPKCTFKNNSIKPIIFLLFKANHLIQCENNCLRQCFACTWLIVYTKKDLFVA